MTARYREIAEDIRTRTSDGEFVPGQQLPSIAELMRHYEVPGLNTVRQAQQLLVDDAMIETRQGVGVFVLRAHAEPRALDVLAELRSARVALDRAITALERTASQPDASAIA